MHLSGSWLWSTTIIIERNWERKKNIFKEQITVESWYYPMKPRNQFSSWDWIVEGLREFKFELLNVLLYILIFNLTFWNKILFNHKTGFIIIELFCLFFFRFYFDEAQGSKISCPIDFPLSNLKVDIMTCSTISKKPRLYDLYGIVNHTGSEFNFRLICDTVYLLK